MKDDVCKEVEGVVETLTEEITDRKGAMNKEQAERKHENEILGNKIEGESRELQEELSVMKDDTKTIKTGSCVALSSAASTGLVSVLGPLRRRRWRPGGRMDGFRVKLKSKDGLQISEKTHPRDSKTTKRREFWKS